MPRRLDGEHSLSYVIQATQVGTSVLATVGRTPLVALERLSADCRASCWRSWSSSTPVTASKTVLRYA